MKACKDCKYCIDQPFCGHKKAVRTTVNYITGEITETLRDTCSGMRQPGGACGEWAKLFKKKGGWE